MKLSKLIAIAPALHALAACKLPIKASFRVGKALAIMQEDMKVYEASRIKLLREFGTPDKFERQFTFPEPEKQAEFAKQHEALIDEDCTFVLPSLKLSELGAIEIEPEHMAALCDMIADEDAPAPAPAKDPAIRALENKVKELEQKMEAQAEANVTVPVTAPIAAEVSAS